MSARRLLAALQVAAVAVGFALGVAAVSTSGAGASSPTGGYPLGFGNDADGQVGSGTANGNGVASPTPAKLPSGVTAVQVAPGYSHTLALGSDGVVYAWGSNHHGELGSGTTTASTLPIAVGLPAGTTVVSVAAGYLDSFAVTTSGEVFAWGYGAQGELGDGAVVDALTPMAVHVPAGVSVSAVSAGYAHVLALSSAGDVYAWGANGAGQLGDGSITTRTEPVKTVLPSGVQATAVSAGYAHSLAVSSDGGVYAWGLNNHGQLGIGTLTSSALPRPVPLGGGSATSVAAGSLHSVATLADGSVLAWGDNSHGQLGTGQSPTNLAQSPVPVPVALNGASVTEAAAGYAHTLLLTDHGTVLAAGDNSYGELGTGDRTSTSAPVPTVLPAGASGLGVATSGFSLTSFVTVAGIDTATAVSSSTSNAIAGRPVTFTATVTPSNGAGTVSFTSGESATPLPGCSGLSLRKVSAGVYRATCSTASLPVGTTAVGAAYSGGAPYLASGGSLSAGQEVHAVRGDVLDWGGNASGQLGDGTTTNRSTPVPASLPTGVVVQVAGGSNHALALTSDGTVYAWGDNTYGELGDGTTTSSTVPTRVTLPDGVVPVSVAAGAFTSVAVAADGSLYTWGLNNVGQLGDGSTTNRSTPVKAALPSGTVVTAASLGAAHLLVLTSTGAVYAAGGNSAGQLGNNSTAPASTPVLVGLPADVAAADVAAGYGHSLAVASDGAVYAWGDDAYQPIGNGTTTDAAVPTAVKLPSGTHVTDAAAGKDSSYALSATGSVLAWGANSSGSLGDGSTTARLTPVSVHLPAAGTPVAIGAGSAAGYAVMPRFASQTSVASSANPSTARKSVTFTATISPSDGGGTVSFIDNGAVIAGCASVALAGTGPYTAKCSTSALGGGSHDIGAHYSGDALYAPSSGSVAQTVNFLVTTTKVSTSAAKISYTKAVTFTAKVTGSDGGGSVAFASDGVPITGCAAQPLTATLGAYQATCKTTTLPPGHHAITAAYSGDAFSAPSSATLSGGELVTAATTLTASPVVITDPQGQPTYRAVLTVTADGTPLSGMSVTFKLNTLYGNSSCTATTGSDGVATCQGARPKISGGQYTAKFAGTDVYLASSGTATVKF